VAGIHKSDINHESSTADWADGLSHENALEYAMFAMDLARKRGDTGAVFGERTGRDLVYESRRMGEFDVGVSNFNALSSMGIRGAALDNQAGLCLIESPEKNAKDAEVLFRRAILANEREAAFVANLGASLYMQRRYPEAVIAFDKIVAAEHDIPVQYLLEYGLSMVIAGREDAAMRERGLSSLESFIARDDVSEGEVAQARAILRTHSV
jgi:tetratricopeptide (TPR) repeat protein